MSIWIWLTLFIILLIVEVVTPSTLVAIWFAFGSAVAMLCNVLNLSVFMQFTAFFLVSLLSMFFVRPLVAAYLKPTSVPTNYDRVIGETAVLIKPIENGEWGTVKVLSTLWHCTNVNQEEIPAGTMIKVVAVEGSKLIVQKYV